MTDTNITQTVIHAYAKINLTLDVFSKRPDGYHDIASVMQSISLHDTLYIRRLESDSTKDTEPGILFQCEAPDAPDVPADATNLVVRAAQKLIDKVAERDGIPPSNTAS